MRKQVMLLWGSTLLLAFLSLLTSALLAAGADSNVLMWSFILIFGLMVMLVPPLLNRMNQDQPAN